MGRVKKSVKVEAPPKVQEWDGKHPLSCSWSLWYFDSSLSAKWEECLKEIGSFSTVEDFWGYMNYIQPPSYMKAGCELCLFKKGVKPMWEDSANMRGGRWDIHLDNKQFSDSFLDDNWIGLAMDLVGGARFGELNEMINGLVVSRKGDKGNRISLWTSASTQRERLIVLGRTFGEIVGLPVGYRVMFRTHADIASNRSCNQIHLCA